MKDMIKCMVLTSALLNTCVVLASCTETTNVVKWTYEISNGGVILGGCERSVIPVNASGRHQFNRRRVGRGRSAVPRSAVPKNTSGGLVIPEKIDGKSVCSIGDLAFSGCANLTSVTIPSGVTNIGMSAFKDAPDFWSVNLRNRIRFCFNVSSR